MTTVEEQKRKRQEEALKDVLGFIYRAVEESVYLEDIFINPDGNVWAQYRGEYPKLVDTMPSHQVRSIINTVAALNGTEVTYNQPNVEATLPFWKARFHGIIPPRVDGPTLSIRLPPSSVFDLYDYVQYGVMTDYQYDWLLGAIQSRENILIVGAPGSGKTSLLNACLKTASTIWPEERVISVEDTPEIVCFSKNYVRFHASHGSTIDDCIRDAMRSRPERIVVGEVRGGEALGMLKAWNTGNGGGMATVHANSAVDGLRRLTELIREATDAPQYETICRTIDVVVFIAKDRDNKKAGRKVYELARVLDYRDKFEVEEL